MARPPSSPLRHWATVALLAATARGQPSPPGPVPEPLPAVFVAPPVPPPAPPPSPAPAHVVSPQLAASLATVLPAFKDSAIGAPADPPPVQPRNKIPRLPVITLPKVVVRERRIREFSERETYTAAGLEDLAVHRYLSDFDRYFLNRINLPIVGESNGYRAMQLFNQDEDIARAREVAELWRLDAIKDPALPAPATKGP